MSKNNKGKMLAVVFTTVCMFVAMLGGFVGLFDAVDTSAPVIADATTSSDYYAPLSDDLNKTGTAFRAQVASLITSTHKTETTYGGLLNVFPQSDADPNKSGNILWFYTGTSVKMPTNFNSGTNREHVWPKQAGDAFPEESHAGSDAHHLRPTDNSLNSSRGNKSFDEVPQTNANIVKENGSSNYDNLCYGTSTFFYPGVGYRGATARILMYLQTRWGDQYNLKFVLGDGHSKTIGDIETLMKWHLEEEPTAEEIARNEAVYKIQGNRNPFIDHPEYAEMIYCYDGEGYNDTLKAVVRQYGSYLDGMADDTVEVTSVSISPSTTNLTVGETVNLTAIIKPDNAVKTVTWTSSNPSVATVVDGKVTALSAGTTTITATSTKTPSVKGTAIITVKSLSAISISGTPTKKSYEAGENFNPVGLTVTATYSDMSTAVIPNSQVQWLDGTTRQATLSKGTTTVIAKVGTIEKTISGITVTQATTATITISRSSFGSTSGAYSWYGWTSGSISGYGFMYPNNKDQIQMNMNKTSKYIYNTTPIPGGIKSITIKGSDGKTFEVRTSSTAFGQVAGGATGGTDRGDMTLSSEGATLNINTSDQYFALTYTSASGAVYIDEIIIVYGIDGGDDTTCQHVASDWIVDSQGNCQVAGSKHTECTKCGEVLDAVEIPASNNHTWGAWTTTAEPKCNQFGSKSRTCSTCGTTETEQIAKTNHTWGDWTVTDPADCGNDGEEARECSACHDVETKTVPKLTNHSWSDWTPDGAGEETRECSVCHKVEKQADANFDWAKDFKDAVEAVKNAERLDTKWNTIKTALSIYNNMKPEHKGIEACVDAYIELEDEISAYNRAVESINSQSERATNDAINLFAGSFAILAFIAYMFSKKA